jgi:hypothetical protein
LWRFEPSSNAAAYAPLLMEKLRRYVLLGFTTQGSA